MIVRAFKLRFRRRLRLQKKQVEELGIEAEKHLERNFFKRLERLVAVRRFVTAWLLLLILIGGSVAAQIQSLGKFYQTISPAAGGVYTEGVLGTYSNVNPIYASSPVDTTVSKLLFASLLTYDDKNQLIGDLARDWIVDERGTTYTFRLKTDLTWHDGKALTAADVVFTYQAIQNSDARSPLRGSWQGIQVSAVDAHTVRFVLANPLASFPYSLTTGIIPKHILEGVSMTALRSHQFNTTKPVGAGPFAFSALEVTGGSSDTREERVALTPFEKYHAGKPKLGSFVVRTFRERERLINSFNDQEVNAMVGMSTVPDEFKDNGGVRVYDLPLTASAMTFFRTSEGVLSDVKIRQALVRAADTSAVIKSLGYPTLPVRGPLLMNQLGYNPAYNQGAHDVAAAAALLETEGWKLDPDGFRRKAGAKLAFKLYAQDSTEYAGVARLLQKQWRVVGADVQVILQDTTEFQTTVAFHGYDALLYGIALGRDPDVFVYWDSAQADIRAANRLNFSEYRSTAADTALEAGRTRSDPSLRLIKYQPFYQAWQADAPALGLYQLRFLYITRQTVYGLTEHPINADVERFTNVHNWMIREVRTSDTE